jgi:hypothetical protein
MQQIRDFYEKKIAGAELALHSIRKTISWFYLARLVIFVIFIAFLIVYFQRDYNYLYLILSGCSLVLFIYAVKYDLKIGNREKYLSSKLSLNREELEYLEFRFSGKETGEEFQKLNPHLGADFEIFGNGSLFQYLNRSSTAMGKKKLAEGLTILQPDKEAITGKQQAIRELTGMTEFVQNFRTYGKLISENGSELTGLQTWLTEKLPGLKFLQLLAVVIPYFNIIWYTLVVFGIFSLNSAIIPLLVSILVISMNNRKINNAHVKLGKTAKTFEKYTTLIGLIENESFRAVYLTSVKGKLRTGDISAGRSLSSLTKLLNRFDIRLNVIASFILNSLIVFDIQILCLLEKWKNEHKNSVTDWFDALSEIDALISFATFAFNNQELVTYPNLSDDAFVFHATDLGHPLIHPIVRINNSLHFEGTPSVIIVTGANMAGKSTFLRTVSVNLIVAMNGAPVCAGSFLFTPCHIMSSIRIQDSLYQNESYFYAELLRIRDIIEHTKSGKRTLVILDEILRGTNTRDKQLGSLGLLEKLIRQNSVVMVATHDLTLGELENKYPDIVSNYCFEVELDNDQLIFDYKLKKGVSRKLNATFLMKKMGIIE